MSSVSGEVWLVAEFPWTALAVHKGRCKAKPLGDIKVQSLPNQKMLT